ncbi:MAG: YebC/PmpR family DNA-binding transcriptional regulator [Acidiphilium sp. 34-60-192]|nr:MAG: YebC/PmpR family DNA-binding transcriptional regulator [Acidiphilium sp. 34-60-192]
MAGHSQFKNIMHRKGAQDARKARQFAKLIREITVSARQGLPDPAANPRLRAACAAARGANMPREGYGPNGVAVIVEALTDNRNRTASDVRTAFAKHGGSLGESNSVSFMFSRVGVVRYLATVDEAALLEAAIEAGADDMVSGAEGHEVLCGVESFFAVRDSLEQRFGEAEGAKLDWRPTTSTPLDEEAARSVFKLIDALEESDDVQNVYANFEIPDAVMQALAG